MCDMHGRYALLDRCTLLRDHCAKKPFAPLKLFPIGPHRRLESGFQADVATEQERIADRHIRCGEASSTHEVIALEARFERAQSRQEPSRVILDCLRLLTLGCFETAVAQDQRLGERQRRFAEVQEIQVGAKLFLVRLRRSVGRVNDARRGSDRWPLTPSCGRRHQGRPGSCRAG